MFLKLLCSVVLGDFKRLHSLARTFIHSVCHHAFHDRTESASTKLILHRLIHDILQCLCSEGKVYLIQLEELDLRAHDGILWLHKYSAQSFAIERIEICKHWQTTDYLRYKSE